MNQQPKWASGHGQLPAGDYVSPGFAVVRLDACFPHMVVGDCAQCPWPYLRAEIPHNWYVDRRSPTIGFINRDEAHILYNTALAFRGQRGLEIGCWLGWSACHLALGGLILDVVDPVLADPGVHQSVRDSLQSAGVLDSVNLRAGASPEAVEALAVLHGRRWSFFFIDGHHGAPAPITDATVCAEHAETDAIILFHDLAAPDVAYGLDYLRHRGWKTMVYLTMQIMGVAWRGNVTPVVHVPDPRVDWPVPSYLAGYEISGGRENKG